VAGFLKNPKTKEFRKGLGGTVITKLDYNKVMTSKGGVSSGGITFPNKVSLHVTSRKKGENASREGPGNESLRIKITLYIVAGSEREKKAGDSI